MRIDQPPLMQPSEVNEKKPGTAGLFLFVGGCCTLVVQICAFLFVLRSKAASALGH